MDSIHPLDISIFRLANYTLANPAAGADFAFPCPINTRLQIISVHFKLSTSTASSNRYVFIQGTHGTTIFCRTGPRTPIGSSAHIYYSYSLLGSSPQTNITASRWNSALSHEFFLQPGESLVSSSVGLDAADQLSLIYIRAKLWTLPY